MAAGEGFRDGVACKQGDGVPMSHANIAVTGNG